MADPCDPAGPLGVEAGAALLQQHCWRALRSFEVLGGLVRTVDAAPLKALLAEASAHAAWHAELFRDRLRVLSNVPLVDPQPAPGDAEVLAALAGLGDDRSVLAGLSRVVFPRSVAAHRAHLARCRPEADAPVARALRFSLADEVDAWQGATALLAGHLAQQGAAAQVAEVVRALDEAAVA